MVRDRTTQLKLNKIYAQKIVNITDSIKFTLSILLRGYGQERQNESNQCISSFYVEINDKWVEFTIHFT